MVTIREETSSSTDTDDTDDTDDTEVDCKFFFGNVVGDFLGILVKNFEEKGKKKKQINKRNWLTFNFSVFFFSMDTDEYSKVYSEVSSFFPFPFFLFSSSSSSFPLLL